MKRGSKPIQDKFTGLKVSHQRKTQLRYREKGLCIICGKTRITSQLCEFHKKQKAFNRIKRRQELRGTRKKTRSNCKFCGKSAYFRFIEKHLEKYHI